MKKRSLRIRSTVLTLSRRFLGRTGISLILILLTACAPESSATNSPAAVTEMPAASEAATVLPVATSRGPELHATDPTTVSLASGGLQFVEFFRFT